MLEEVEEEVVKGERLGVVLVGKNTIIMPQLIQVIKHSTSLVGSQIVHEKHRSMRYVWCHHLFNVL
jgi:hypothetical protein